MRRILVTLHYPLEMSCVAAILRAVSVAYPDARVGEDGTVWDGPETPLSAPISGHARVHGFCPTCGGSCLIGFGNR